MASLFTSVAHIVVLIHVDLDLLTDSWLVVSVLKTKM